MEDILEDLTTTSDYYARIADKVLELDKLATKAPWNIWGGPEFCGGGADLCIASGDGSDDWLANMDHRFNHYAGAHNHNSAKNCKAEDVCDICSFCEDVTKEQRANADLIKYYRTAAVELAHAVKRLLEENSKEYIRGYDAHIGAVSDADYSWRPRAKEAEARVKELQKRLEKNG